MINREKPLLDTQPFEQLRCNLLNYYKSKQNFRVSIGKSSWIIYDKFNSNFNLREILNDEVVIELDSKKKWEEMDEQEKQDFKDFSWTGINLIGVELYKNNISFEIWDHEGKSPHLHIHNLPIKHLNDNQRTLFKKIFIKKYVSKEYLSYVDLSLTNVHLIAIEYQNHWKGCYGYKKLLSKFNPKKDLGNEKII